MRPFRYERATDISEAVAMLAGEPNAAFLGAGTNLVDHMRLGIATPDLLIDVRTLTSDRIEELPDGGVRIGAAVPNSDAAADRLIPRRYPVLAEAILSRGLRPAAQLRDHRRGTPGPGPGGRFSGARRPRPTTGGGGRLVS